MSRELDADRRVVFVRTRGRVTIPASSREKYGLEEGSELIVTDEDGQLVIYPRREGRLDALLDEIAEALRRRGITLEDLVEDDEEIREEVFKERYPNLADKYDL